jgi:hypothetical protein
MMTWRRNTATNRREELLSGGGGGQGSETRVLRCGKDRGKMKEERGIEMEVIWQGVEYQKTRVRQTELWLTMTQLPWHANTLQMARARWQLLQTRTWPN